MEDGRLVRRTLEDQLSPAGRRSVRLLGAFASGGVSPFFETSQEHLRELESRGFDLATVQSYLNDLELDGEEESAAMLRGASNDLLDRIDALQPPQAPETAGSSAVSEEDLRSA